jgi:flagellar biosynthesis chaperone FliJ
VLLALHANSSAQEQIDPKVAVSLAKFGFVVVTGSAKLIAGVPQDPNGVSPGQLGSDLGSLVSRYRTEVQRATFASDLVRANGEVIITATQVMAASTGVGALPSLAMGAAARYGNDKFAGFIAKEGKERAVGVLSSGLQKMTASDRTQFDKMLADQRYDDAAKLFDQRTGKLTSMAKSLKDDPEGAALAQQYVVDSLREGTSTALIQAGKARAAVTNVESQLSNHVRASHAFAKEVKTRVGTLETASKELAQQISGLSVDLEELKKDQKATANQVSLVTGILFEQQPPQTKLAMLEANAFPGLSTEQKEIATKALKVEIKKQEVLAVASKVVSAAADVSTILTNFGIKDQGLSEAVKYGTVATTALSQAFTGNYLGAIASVSGLFGGGGAPDPNAAQFERVFKELGQIREQLNTVIELQKKTLLAIEQLSKQLAQVEVRLHDRLDRINFEVARVDKTTRQALWSSYATCDSVWANRANPSWQYDEGIGFRSVLGLSSMLRDRSGEVFSCATKLRGVFSQLVSAGNFDNPLRLEYVGTSVPVAPTPDADKVYTKSELQVFLDDVYKPSYTLTASRYQLRQQKWGSLAGLLAMLTAPAATSTDLFRRVQRLDANSTGQRLNACAPQDSWLSGRMKVMLCTDGFIFDPAQHGGQEGLAEQRTDKFMRDPIIRDQVRDIAQWAAMVASASDFARGGDPSSVPMSLQELANYGWSRDGSPGRQVLLGALMLSDIAVAQHALVYGDLTAYFVYETLWDTQLKRFRTPGNEAEKAAEKLLKNRNNPWLQRNVAMLVLAGQERNCRGAPCAASDVAYTLAVSPLLGFTAAADGTAKLPAINAESASRAGGWMHAMFDLDASTTFWALDADAAGAEQARVLVMRSNGIEIAMPLATDWARRLLSYPQELSARLRERELLARRWADYTSLQMLSVEQQVRLTDVMSKGVPP